MNVTLSRLQEEGTAAIDQVTRLKHLPICDRKYILDGWRKRIARELILIQTEENEPSPNSYIYMRSRSGRDSRHEYKLYVLSVRDDGVIVGQYQNGHGGSCDPEFHTWRPASKEGAWLIEGLEERN